MDNVILGLFIGVPSVLVLASLIAWFRIKQQRFEPDET